MRYLATVSYLGTNYQGWQRQEGVISVQEVIENSISKLYNHEVSIFGSGRTDAGVHALGQTFHFDVEPKYEIEDMIYKINCILPDDIQIKSINIVNDEFHARYHAKGKKYYYLIENTSKNPILLNRCWLYKETIDYELLITAAKLFEGEHCFKDFTSKDVDEKNFIRNIYSINVIKNNDSCKISFYGNGFMKYQIRFMVGTIMAVASKRISIDYIKEHLNNVGERKITNLKAPGYGLYLEQVEY